MITINKQRIHQSVRKEATGLNMIKRDSDINFKQPKNKKKKNNNNKDPYTHLTLDDLQNDSDFDSASDIDSNMSISSKKIKRNSSKLKKASTQPKIKKKTSISDKNDFKKIKIVNNNHSNIKKSGLGMLLEKNKQQFTQYQRHNPIKKDQYRNDSSDDELISNKKNGINIKIYFEAFLETIEPLLIQTNEGWTVSKTINEAIKLFRQKYPKKKLKSNFYYDYEFFCVDIDDDDIEIDRDTPAFDRERKVNELGLNAAGLVYKMNKNFNNINKNLEMKINNDNNNNNDNARYRSKTLIDKLNQKNDYGDNPKNGKIFIKIQIPGPTNQSHVFSVEKDQTAFTLRDVFSLLNKRTKAPQYSAKYFDFYYKGETKNDPLQKMMKCIDLPKKELVMLPKIISQNEDTSEAYEYPLVKLANEIKEFTASKIKSNKKQTRILAIDRYRIVKKVAGDNTILGFGKKESIPIDITCIKHIRVNNSSNKQFIIEYIDPKVGLKSQIYEMENTKDAREICNKLQYLCILRKLQG